MFSLIFIFSFGLFNKFLMFILQSLIHFRTRRRSSGCTILHIFEMLPSVWMPRIYGWKICIKLGVVCREYLWGRPGQIWSADQYQHFQIRSAEFMILQTSWMFDIYVCRIRLKRLFAEGSQCPISFRCSIV